ncbi:hypothetical protein CAP36_06335 [Chitinophagaceae bacterium IBVUCB2]|nr:hypothetical protein CAP36_06335 [Chitinophagaceae bacterium IBVUCB2]
MENRFNNRDFEQFVKQSADQYRMFPSEKVWNSIHNTLHTRRRWYGIGLSLLLVTTAAVTWIMLISPSSRQEQLASTLITTTSNEFIEQEFKTQEIVIAPKKITIIKPTYIASPDNLQENLFLAETGTPVTSSDDIYTTSADENLIPEAVALPAPVTATKVSNDPTIAINRSKTSSVISKKQAAPVVKSANPDVLPVASINIAPETTSSNLTISIIDSEEPSNEEEKPSNAAEEKSLVEKNELYPLTIESVTNSYIKLGKKRKASWEIYFLPTISYRKLSENKNFLLKSQANNAPANNSINENINDVVTHKPDVGLEAGLNVGFPISKNLKFTTGLQLNVSKYDIKAYPYQREDARIALSSDFGRTSVSTIQTNYRAQESYTKPHWLSNYYVSASLPIGAELKIARLKSNNGYLGIGGTIQPTYTLIDRAYIISTDFKNYAKLPSLTRDWNLNSSFEIFAGYSTKKLDWKIGPQVRYQVLSSFYKRYPVKEHLMNYGLKLAVILNK